MNPKASGNSSFEDFVPKIAMDYWISRLTEADASRLARSVPRVELDVRALDNGKIVFLDNAQAAKACQKICMGTDSVISENDIDPEEIGRVEKNDGVAREKKATYEAQPCAIVLAFSPKGVQGTFVDNPAQQLPLILPVYWIPVELTNRDDCQVIARKEAIPPQFFRQWLSAEPSDEDQVNALGELADYMQELERFPAHVTATRILDCVNLFKAVTNTVPSKCKFPGYSILSDKSDYKKEQKLSLRAYLVPQIYGSSTYWLSILSRSINKFAKRDKASLDQSAYSQIWQRDQLETIDPKCVPKPDDLKRHIAMAGPIGGTEYGLNASQRRIVAATTIIGKKGIIGVNGPPGTGKTELLRAVIADRWTRAALNGNKVPPVIVVVGATHQSIRNVAGTLDNVQPQARNFSEINDWADLLQTRWLSGCGSVPYSIRAPSGTEQEKSKADKKKYSLIDGFPTHSSAFKEAEYRDHIPSLERHFRTSLLLFLKLAGQGKTETSRSIMPWTPEQLATHNRGLSSIDSGKSVSQAITAMSAYAYRLQLLLEDLVNYQIAAARNGLSEERIDRELRPIAFHLAARYWEARWIVGLPQQQNQSFVHKSKPIGQHYEIVVTGDRKNLLDASIGPIQEGMRVTVESKSGLFSRVIGYLKTERLEGDVESRGEEGFPKLLLRRTAMLFPCIVTTVNTLPKLFRARWKYKEQEFHYGLADLLVVDEAGQAAAELAAPLFSLASMVLAIGDLKQLSPVTHLNDAIDNRILADLFDNDASKVKRFIDLGWSHQRGSCLALALEASCDNELGGKGLRLREHYRCPRRIVEFCTDLMYHDHERGADGEISLHELIFVEGPESDFPLPPFAYVMSGAIEDEGLRKDLKWTNRGEANALCYWLLTEGLRAFAEVCESTSHSSKPVRRLADFIAILTPYGGQAKLIRSILRSLAEGAKCEDIDDHLWDIIDGEKSEIIGSAFRGPFEQRLIIGTVHSLQGAERPLILFSAVNSKSTAKDLNDDTRNKVFIDRDDGRMLNVAVSRAKKSFVLFGHADLFFSPEALKPRDKATLPTALLGQHLAGISDDARSKRSGIKVRAGRRLSPHTLIIVESPEKARTLSSFLPPTFQAYATGGRLRDLDFKTFTERGDALNIHPIWVVKSGVHAEKFPLQTSLIKAGSRLLALPQLVIATDPDPEGEAIAWHIGEILKLHPFYDQSTLKVARLVFSSPSRIELLDGLQSAIADPKLGPLQRTPSGDAAVARDIVDALIGRWWSKSNLGRVAVPVILEVQRASTARPQKWFLSAESSPFSKDADCGTSIPVYANPISPINSRGWSVTRSVRMIAPPKGYSTFDLLSVAWRQNEIIPGDVMFALDALRFGTEEEARQMAFDEAAILESVDGRFRVRPDQAGLVDKIHARSRSLPGGGALSFAKYVNEKLDGIGKGDLNAVQIVREIAKQLYPQLIIGLDDFVGTSSNPFEECPWLSRFGKADHVSEISVKQMCDVDTHRLRASSEAGAKERLESGRSRIKSRGRYAHPPLMASLDEVGSLNLNQIAQENATARQILAILVDTTKAAVMRPSRVFIETWSGPAADQDLMCAVAIGYTDGTGWLDHVSAQLRADALAQNHLIDSGDRRPANFGAWLRRASLTVVSEPGHTVGSLLDFLFENNLGTPGTYAQHIDGALGLVKSTSSDMIAPA